MLHGWSTWSLVCPSKPRSSASSLAAFVRLPLFWPSWFPPSSEHIKSLLPEGVGTCRLLSLNCSPSPFLAHSYSSYRTQHKCPFLSHILLSMSALPLHAPSSKHLHLSVSSAEQVPQLWSHHWLAVSIHCVCSPLPGLTDVCFSLCRLHKPQSLACCGCCLPGEQISIWLI